MTHALSSIIDLTNAPTPPRWFEFLLEPGRLQQHLETTGCDPSPIQLIALFFRNILSGSSFHGPTNGDVGEAAVTSNGSANNNTNKTNITDLAEKLFLDIGADADGYDVVIPPDSYEVKYRMRKTYALQTLSVKVASFLKWDLDKICDGLTIPIQYKLMQALTAACSNEACPPEVKKFASVIYCHWFLRSAITYRLSTLQSQSSSTTIIYLSQLQQQQQTADNLALMTMGELFSNNSKQLKNCSEELHTFITELTRNHKVAPSSKKLKTHDHPFRKAKLSRPKMECFDSRDEQFNDWTQCETIESFDFIEAACYDLGRFFFFEESYLLAKESFEIIRRSTSRYPLLEEYLKSANDILTTDDKLAEDEDELSLESCDIISNEISTKRKQTEKYLFDCMSQFSQSQKEMKTAGPDKNDKNLVNEDEIEEDCDLRFEQQALACQHRLAENSAWYLQVPIDQQQQQFLEVGKGDILMSRGNFKQAMGCFVGALMLMTDFFRIFSKNYVDEEPYITRMIQCSISLSCYTQAVALCQMTKNLNYTIAFNQLNERICNDCCDDIYECIWNVTLLEYIISLHAKRGEVERRTKVIQLIGQLELNENNPEEILQEAEHVRRGRFFRIMSNKYL